MQLQEQKREIQFQFENYKTSSFEKEVLKYHQDLDKFQKMRMQYTKKIQESYQNTKSIKQKQKYERGGNNVSQNIKKCFLSILKKQLSKQEEQEFLALLKEQNVKSQKQNIVILPLLLFYFHLSRNISLNKIQGILEILYKKIQIFIQNSLYKTKIQEERYQFHKKNAEQFQKCLDLKINFRDQKLNLKQINRKLMELFRRKKKLHQIAEERVLQIIRKYSLENLFSNGETIKKEVKIQE